MSHIGSGPVAPEYIEAMRTLAKGIDRFFNGDGDGPKMTGFVLMVFPFDDMGTGRCNYMSNAERSDIIVMLKEQLRYFEGQNDGTVGHA